MTVIKDSSTGTVASVDGLKRLTVFATQLSEEQSSIALGKTWNITTGELTLTADTASAVQYLKNTGTTTITTPGSDGSLVLTDMIISGERQNASTTEVRFTDDTEAVTIFLASATDAPPQIALNFAGRVQGWKDARIDMITVGAADSTVFLGYMKVPTGIPYSEWDALR